MYLIQLPRNRFEDEGVTLYEINCDECGAHHDVEIPDRYLEAPSCDVDRMDLPCQRSECDGFVHWQPPDDSEERRREAIRRVKEDIKKRRSQVKRMASGEMSSGNPEIDNRAMETARMLQEMGYGNPDEETFEAMVEEEIKYLRDQARQKVRQYRSLKVPLHPVSEESDDG